MVGPTASGKSALAQELAERFDADIVSVDSMQVYRGMDIGTAKPSPAERRRVPHHLIDLADPDEDYSVARYRADAAVVLSEMAARDRRVLMVGGTGLYLRAVVDDLDLPGQWPEVRAQLEAQADDIGVPALHARLASLDPLAASRAEPANRRRVVRALEVCVGAGRPFSSFGPGLAAYPATRFVLLGLNRSREELGERIARRYREQMDAGFLDEVAALARRPAGLSRTARQALGYREILAHLEDGVGLEEALAGAIRRTRSFARRQQAWFGRDPRIRWLEPAANLASVAAAVLGEWWG
ncbi:MAG: tRNA (adenosine(37)-N6)-dimethylallyltransferase MiaA [Acidimicrobiales bacterium]